MSLLRTLFWVSRPISWVNTAYPYGFAYLLAGGSWRDWVFWVGVLFFLVPYNLAMYGINDVFDYESDLRNPRKGGVEGALAQRSTHRPILWASAVSCLPFLVVLFVAGGLWSGLALAVSMFAVVAYSAPPFRFKEVPFLDSVTSATHFVAPAVVGAYMLGGTVPPDGWYALAAFFCWCMASHAFGAVQDIQSDRAAGIGSIATVWGARVTVWFSIALYVAASALLLATPPPWAWVAILPCAYIANSAPSTRLTDERSAAANSAWGRFIWLNMAVGGCVTVVALLLGRA